jgi:hypothetical protein
VNLEAKRAIIRAKFAQMKVEKLAKQLDAKLLANDPRLSGAVHIVHMDSTSLFFDRAFALRVRTDENLEDEEPVWLIVLTEHHGAHVYRSDDLRVVRTYKMGPAVEEIRA